jgi:hypothetical protein
MARSLAACSALLHHSKGPDPEAPEPKRPKDHPPVEMETLTAMAARCRKTGSSTNQSAKIKIGHLNFQNRPPRLETGQYRQRRNDPLSFAGVLESCAAKSRPS